MIAQYTMDKPYDYPVKPGMKEWTKFQSNEEMGILKDVTDEQSIRVIDDLSYQLIK